MNRNQEYFELMEELESNAPDLRQAVSKARSRRKKAAFIYRPLASVAACFAVFVLLVNFSTPIAHACSQVPVLRELAAAVTFSRSLSDAVENEYVQPMNLTQTQKDITAEIAYLIVDQKQVNVFYRLNSNKYGQLEADFDVLNVDGSQPEFCSYSSNSFGVANGELRSMTIDFVDGNVPGCLRIQLRVYDDEIDYSSTVTEQEVDDWAIPEDGEIAYITQFDFSLEFDPEFTSAGKIFPVDRIVDMDGQKITVTQIEVYPTHIRVDIEEHPENSAWLMYLNFYIEADGEMKFEPVDNGISATGSADSPAMTSYRADSTYFYEAEHLELVITGAQWLRKDMDKTYVNLMTGETGELPAGITFESAVKNGAVWTVTFRADHTEGEPVHQIFGNQFYDADGKEYEFNARSSTYGEKRKSDGSPYFLDQYALHNYPYDEVWLSPHFSHNWIAEDKIVVVIQ